MASIVNHRFIRPNGTAVPFKDVLCNFVGFGPDGKTPLWNENGGVLKGAHDSIEKEAKERGAGFYDVLLDKLRTMPKSYQSMRQALIANREIEPSEADEGELLRNLPNGEADFLTIIRAMGGDVRKTVDALSLIYPNLGIIPDAAYHIVTRLVTGRVKIEGEGPREDPLSALKELTAKIQPSVLKKNEALAQLCCNAAEEAYLLPFVKDPKAAFGRLDADIAAETRGSVRFVLEKTRKYYRKIDSLRVDGAVERITDREGQSHAFPSVHQKAGVQKIIDLKRVLIADEMGVGKTAQAFLAFVHLCRAQPATDHKALVICPGGLVDHWCSEISRYLTPEAAKEFQPVAILSGNKEKALENAKNAKIVVISYDMLIRSLNGEAPDETRLLSSDSDAMKFQPQEAGKILDELASMGFTYVTIDEVHRAKNPRYATPPDVIASKYLKEPGRKRLIVCDEDEVGNWKEELDLRFSGADMRPNIVAIENGSIEGVEGADIVIAPRSHAKKIMKKASFEVDNEESLDVKPDCLRSAAVRKLVSSPSHGGAEYVVLLTGTPLPNKIADIGNLAAMLEPDDYPTAMIFNQQSQQKPSLIRELLLRRMVRRRVEQVMCLPKLETVPVDIELPPLQKEIYQTVQDGMFDPNPYTKLWWTRMASIRPSLLVGCIDRYLEQRNAQSVDEDGEVSGPLKAPLRDDQVAELMRLRELAGKSPSAKFDKLSELVESEVKAGRKVVIFSSLLRQDIIQPLEEMIAAKGIPVAHIDGEVPEDKRKEIRDAFQGGRDPSVIVATLKTLGEGISLTAASTVIFLDYPFTDAEFKQGRARVWRQGQRKPVTVYVFMARNTLDENAELLVKEKERIARLLIDGILPTSAEKAIYEANKALDAGPFKEALQTPREALMRHFSHMFGMSSSFNRNYLSKGGWKNGSVMVDFYLRNWDTSYAANNGRAVKNLVEAIEKSEGRRFGRIADLAGGPATMTRITGRKTTCIDINRKMLERARADFGGRVDAGEASLIGLPLASESQDLAVISLALHYMRSYATEKQRRSERETSLREALRILRPGGWLVISEPAKRVDEGGIKNLRKGLEKLGCETGCKAGFANDPESGGKKFSSFLFAVKKAGEPKGEPDADAFLLKTNNIANLRKKRGQPKAVMEMPDGKKWDEFLFEALDGNVTLLEASGWEPGTEAEYEKHLDAQLAALASMENTGEAPLVKKAHRKLDDLAEKDAQHRAGKEPQNGDAPGHDAPAVLSTCYNGHGDIVVRSVRAPDAKKAREFRNAKDSGEKK